MDHDSGNVRIKAGKDFHKSSPGLDTVDCHRITFLSGKLKLCQKNFLLLKKISIADPVKADFANTDGIFLDCSGQPVQPLFFDGVTIPGMNAEKRIHRIMLFGQIKHVSPVPFRCSIADHFDDTAFYRSAHDFSSPWHDSFVLEMEVTVNKIHDIKWSH